MRCDATFALMLFMVAAKAPPASAVLFLTPFGRWTASNCATRCDFR